MNNIDREIEKFKDNLLSIEEITKSLNNNNKSLEKLLKETSELENIKSNIQKEFSNLKNNMKQEMENIKKSTEDNLEELNKNIKDLIVETNKLDKKISSLNQEQKETNKRLESIENKQIEIFKFIKYGLLFNIIIIILLIFQII